MSYLDDLRRLREIKKSGFVAFAKNNTVTYYAINGIERGTPGETNVSKELESMYKTNINIRCTSNDSYTIINPKTFGHYVMFKDNIKKTFDILYNTGNIYFEDIISPKTYDANFDNHNWCCCERKIIGYLYNNKLIGELSDTTKLYILERPCLLCVPMVTKVYYLDEYLNLKYENYHHEMIGLNTMKITI